MTQAEAHSWVEDLLRRLRRLAHRRPDPGRGARAVRVEDTSITLMVARRHDPVPLGPRRGPLFRPGPGGRRGLGGEPVRRPAFNGIRAWAARIAAALALLAGLGWFGRRRLPARPRPGPGRIRELRPLLRKARGTLPPLEAETARAWLGRLAVQRPHRAAHLERLATLADASVYGGQPSERLKDLAKEEARNWGSRAG